MTLDVHALIENPDRTAMLVVDMQNDFVIPGAPIAAPGALDVVPVISELSARARRRGFPVVYTQEMHRPDEADFGIELHFEPPHCLEGTAGFEVIDQLKPEPGDIRITGKRRYDAFLGTDLDLVLRAGGVQNLIVTGVCTDICVTSTVQHARNLDYRCFVVREGVAGTSPERHEAALLCLEHVFAYVGSAEECRSVFGI
ncbi:MAG: cysteine hydrolase [Actinobacteria bacterium]|nr:cysteine hydrolase [Actinomycetota bacterium]